MYDTRNQPLSDVLHCYSSVCPHAVPCCPPCAVPCFAVFCGVQVVPRGLAGAVGMFRNWTFTLFFCMSELWGDVCMGLLFWG